MATSGSGGNKNNSAPPSFAKPPNIAVRGIRTQIPQGYLLGRVSAGHGRVELIKASTLGLSLGGPGGSGGGFGGGGLGGGGGGGGASAPVVFEFLGFSAQGTFTSRQQFNMAIAPRKVLLPSASAPLSRNIATAGVAPTSNTSFVLVANIAGYLSTGTGVICTVSFAAGSKTGTFAYGPPYTVAAGQVLGIVMNAVADPTFSQVQTLFVGDPQ